MNDKPVIDFDGFVKWWQETYNPEMTEEGLTALAKVNLVNGMGKRLMKNCQSSIEAIDRLNEILDGLDEDDERAKEISIFIDEKERNLEELIENYEKYKNIVYGDLTSYDPQCIA